MHAALMALVLLIRQGAVLHEGSHAGFSPPWRPCERFQSGSTHHRVILICSFAHMQEGLPGAERRESLPVVAQGGWRSVH